MLLLAACAQTPNWQQAHQDPNYLVPDSVQYDISEIFREKFHYTPDLGSLHHVQRDINEFIVINISATTDKNKSIQQGTARIHKGTCSQGFGYLDTQYISGKTVRYEINYREWKNAHEVQLVKWICSQLQH